MKRLVAELTKEYLNKSMCYKEIMDCYIILIFYELLEIHKTKNEKTLTSDSKINIDNIAEMMKYIEENYAQTTLREVAKKFHFHPNYLSTLIKKTTGKSFKDIIHEQRLKKATTLLKSTDMSIEDISIEVGYNNQTFFYKKFKETYSLTPKKYRIKSRILLKEVYHETIYS
ncbi:TPA: helix-turn-helix transcriptional regulator [Clostridioides difficile]|nr:helix-turn-helix transcriptional regulator [Clostridioides difficile]